MVSQIRVWLSLDENMNLEVMKLLDELEKKNDTNIRYFTDIGILDKVVTLPFIETDNGVRWFGVESIGRFVKRELLKEHKLTAAK